MNGLEELGEVKPKMGFSCVPRELRHGKVVLANSYIYVHILQLVFTTTIFLSFPPSFVARFGVIIPLGLVMILESSSKVFRWFQRSRKSSEA